MQNTEVNPIKSSATRIHVVAAIIWSDNRDEILVSKRPQHLHKGGYWEFPGGKLEEGETLLQALDRELKEELNLSFSDWQHCETISHDYPDKSVLLDFFHVFGVFGDITALEGQDIRWVQPTELVNLEFPEANRPIVEKLWAMA